MELAGGAPSSTNLSWVYGPYFQTLGIRLKSGRVFSDVETIEPRGVVIVNERLARTFWPGQDAVGKRLRWGLNVAENQNPWLTIVGVIADVADGPLGAEPFVHAYEPFSQFPDIVLNNIPTTFGRQVKLAVRTDADPRAARICRPRRDRHASIGSSPLNRSPRWSIALARWSPHDASARWSLEDLRPARCCSRQSVCTVCWSSPSANVSARSLSDWRWVLSAAEILRMVIGHGLKLVSIGLVLGVGRLLRRWPRHRLAPVSDREPRHRHVRHRIRLFSS